MGGGFGGCTLNLIKKNHVQQFVEMASNNYKEKYGIELTPYSVNISNGANVI